MDNEETMPPCLPHLQSANLCSLLNRLAHSILHLRRLGTTLRYNRRIRGCQTTVATTQTKQNTVSLQLINHIQHIITKLLREEVGRAGTVIGGNESLHSGENVRVRNGSHNSIYPWLERTAC